MRRVIVIPFVAVAVTVCLASDARSQAKVTFVPAVSFSTVYDDNLFARAQGDAGVMTWLRPSFETDYESPRFSLFSLYSFDMQRSNHSALNMLDARRHGNADLRYRTTPKFTLGLGARYDRTETPGEISLDTGLLGDRRRAERLEVVPSFGYRFNPRTIMTANYGWTTEALVEGMAGTLQVARAGVTRQTSTRDEITVTLLGRRFVDTTEIVPTPPAVPVPPPVVDESIAEIIDDPSIPETTLRGEIPISTPALHDKTHMSYAALFGWTRELAFATRLTLQGGPRVSTYRNTVVPEVVAALMRRTNRVRLSVDYWHGETIVLGIRGPVSIDSATARAIWPVKRTVEIGTHAGVSDATTLDGENARVYRGFLVGSWSPKETFTIAASYGVDVQNGIIRRTLLSDEHVLRHTLRITLTVAPRLSRSIQRPGEPPTMRPKGVQE